MIIINSGLPKSGTTLVMTYQKELISSFYKENGIRESMKYSYGGYIDLIDDKTADRLYYIHEKFGPLVVKTHTEPTPAIKKLIKSGKARATFSYRDPRDIILSALDHGKLSRETSDPTKAFSDVKTFSKGFILSGIYLKTYESWLEFNEALFIRYEDLMKDKLSTISKLSEYFNISAGSEVLKEIYSKNELKKESALNFNSGEVQRWRTELPPDQLALCNKSWGKTILKMGYKLN